MASITVICSIVLIVAIADAPILLYFEFLDLLYIYRRFASFKGFSVTMLKGFCVGVKTEKPTGDGGLRQVSKK